MFGARQTIDRHTGHLEVPRWTCVLLIVLGLCAYGVTASIDVTYGAAVTVTERGQYLQGASTFLVPGFAFALASFAGFLFNCGRWGWGIFTFLLIAAFMGFSATNGVSFVASETIGKTRLADSAAKQSADIAAEQNAALLKSRQETTAWLQRTYMSEHKAADKDRVLDRITEIAAAPVALKPVTPTTALADAKSVVFSRLLGWDPESVQVANAMWLVALLIAGKLAGPTLGFAFWPRRLAAERWRARPPETKFDGNPLEIGRKLSKAEAREDILRMVQLGGRMESGRALSERWGVPPGTVSKWCGDFRREGLIRRVPNGNARAIVADLRHINGAARAQS